MDVLKRLAALVFGLASAAVPAEEILKLPIGDAARKDREAPVVLDAITDTSSGALLTPADLPGKLSDVRLVLVGEEHIGMDFHRVEKRVIEGLDRSGRRVMIGLEMYPYPEQKWLDDWTDGKVPEEAFLDSWYRNWGYNWLYYRDIFLYARDHRLRMFAVNAPPSIVGKVRQKGFESLTPEEAAHIPKQIDTKSPDHLRLFKASFDEEASFHMGGSDAQWQAMLNAQCTWDATMAWNAAAPIAKDPDPKAVMVVLAGMGHVQYGLGIERQAKQWYAGRIASVIPVEVEDEKKGPVKSVQASYANFVWGVPGEVGSLYPDLGLANHVRPDRRLEVLDVEKDTPASAAGFQVGDLLLTMDGVDLVNRETLARLVAGKRWGDAAAFTVKRNEETVPLPVVFRRVVKEKKDEKAKAEAPPAAPKP
ncbi:MAG TPA: ChaN family lipoprotein [Thermoanaerobaculia bacterium]|nr:ChaN family lipoprotein [Thermoanaerobaculia bacterium]